jgi:tetratricopeptide (TPR) repeat protein
LAITIAGSFMRETNCSIREYLQYYEDSWHDLQSRAKPGRHYKQGNLLQTWLVSYDEIRKRNPSVATLMLLLAHFDNRDIWYELVKCAENSSNLPICLVDVVSDALIFNDNMRTLNKFSLIETNQQSGSYSIHPVVQDWCLDMARIDNDELNIPWYELAVIAVGYMVNSASETDEFNLERRLLVHADFVRQKSEISHLIDDTRLWSAFDRLGAFYNLQGKPNEAETMFQQALTGYTRTVGPDHIHTLDAVGKLGKIYRVQGKLKEAEIMQQQALTGYKKELGPGNIATLNAIGNLGSLYRDQGRFKEAEMMWQQALEGYKTLRLYYKLSSLDEFISITLNSLNLLYESQGRLKEAEMISQQALEHTEKALASDLTPTSDTTLRLGKLYRELGNPTKAEMMHQRVLASYEKALGPEHPSTLDTMNHLAGDYQKQGKLKEAEMMCQRALAGYEKVLGSDHLSTLIAVDSLGILYLEQGKLKEVEILYQESLANREKTLGPDHPLTLSMMNNLANSYRRQRKLEKAQIMYQQALAGYEKTLGLDHLSTLDTIRCLGWVYSDQGRPKEADIMYQRTLAGYEKVLGPNNPMTKSISQELRIHRWRVSIDFWFWPAVAGFLFVYYVFY